MTPAHSGTRLPNLVLSALLLFLIPSSIVAFESRATRPTTSKTHDQGSVALCLFDDGLLGNNFQTRDPSLEYPRGSEIDHLMKAGLWVGGVNANFDTLVTTTVHDSYWGWIYWRNEWLQDDILPEAIVERSTLPSSPYFDPLTAVSEQDFVLAFLDTLAYYTTPQQGNADSYHFPSGLRVLQESFTWSGEPADAVVFIRWTFTPVQPLYDTVISLYAELTTGWKGQYPQGSWPPSSANWFHHHQLVWVDDLPQYDGLSDSPFNMVAEYNAIFPEEAPQHAGLQFLGAKLRPVGEEWSECDPSISWRWWNWEPGNIDRDNDREKYAIMTAPGIDDWTLIEPSASSSGDSPIQLLNIGPWSLFPGDTLRVNVAWLGGDDMDDLVQNALFAQETYVGDFDPQLPRVFEVEADGSSYYPTIQSAITAAGDGDTVILSDSLFTGVGNRDVDLQGKALTIRSAGGDPALCIIDCAGSAAEPHRGLLLIDGEGEGTVISGIGIRNGWADQGGAIRCVGSSPLLEDCVMVFNTATEGGVLHAEGGTLRLVGCSISHNETLAGGAVHLTGGADLQLENSLITLSSEGAAVTCDTGSALLTCCNVFGNPGGDWAGCLEGQEFLAGNLAADPLFCAADEGYFLLSNASPCLPDNNDCGLLIGACNQGCMDLPPEARILILDSCSSFAPGSFVADPFWQEQVAGLFPPGEVYLHDFEVDGFLAPPEILEGVFRHFDLICWYNGAEGIADAEFQSYPTLEMTIAENALRTYLDQGGNVCISGYNLVGASLNEHAGGSFSASFESEVLLLDSLLTHSTNLPPEVDRTCNWRLYPGREILGFSDAGTDTLLNWTAYSGIDLMVLNQVAVNTGVVRELYRVAGCDLYPPSPEDGTVGLHRRFDQGGDLVLLTFPPAHADGYNNMLTQIDSLLATMLHEESSVNEEFESDEPVTPVIASLGVMPNPFNLNTLVCFTLSAESRVRIAIYNITGARVRTLVDSELVEGEHEVVWDGRDDSGRVLASGVYLLQLRSTEDYRATAKLVLLK